MQHDMTPRFLSIVASIMTSDPALRRAWLRGREWKPAAGDAATAGLTWSEPFVDVNDNKRFDRDEPFLDKDGNESFTRTFVSKLPDDGGPLIGVMERYWLGSWQLVQVEESTP
jgi:hypothetical protein